MACTQRLRGSIILALQTQSGHGSLKIGAGDFDDNNYDGDNDDCDDYPTNNLSRRRKEVRACRQIRKGDEVDQISMLCNDRNPHSLYIHAERSHLIACISMLKILF